MTSLFRHAVGLSARSFRSAWPARRLGALLAAALLGLPTAAAQAPPVPGADLASVHAWLREHNPELRAHALEAEAARARIEPAGALPDPTVGIAFRDLDPDRPWRLDDKEGEIELSLRQRLPLWGKRGLARTAARQLAEAADLEHEAVARELLVAADSTYVRYWHADRAIAVLDRRLALLRQVEEFAGLRYALGLAAQQDAIQAQVEQTRLRRERIARLAARQEAAAQLNALLGRAVEAPLAAAVEAPALAVHSASLSVALEGLRQDPHPAVLAQAARVQAAVTTVELQQRNRRPDLTVGLGAVQHDGGLRGLELMFEVEVPFQQRARRERELEARRLADAASAREEATRNTVAAGLAIAWSQWTSARERRELTENTLLPQADAAFQSALASYQVGAVDFGTLLQALDQWQGADLDRVDALRDELLGAAAVRAIEGDTP
jgi:outer membrane protein, heavy metal efflux system